MSLDSAIILAMRKIGYDPWRALVIVAAVLSGTLPADLASAPLKVAQGLAEEVPTPKGDAGKPTDAITDQADEPTPLTRPLENERRAEKPLRSPLPRRRATSNR